MGTTENNNSSRWTSDHHEILGGKATILKTQTSNGVWQFRAYISGEGKYVRQSLRTRDLETAKIKAEEKVFEIYGNINAGKKIFGLKLYELIDKYLEYRETHVERGVITAGRLVTIKSQLKHFADFKDPKIKLSELERNSVGEYERFRHSKGAKPVTIRNEQATINAMIKWGYGEGLCSIPKFNFEPISIKEPGRRDTFTRKEYRRLTEQLLRSWTNSKNNSDKKIQQERLLVRSFILVLSNTLLRVGEARQLKWKDILSMDYKNKDESEKAQLAHIRVRGETSKTGKNRDIVVRGGNHLKVHKERAKYTNPDDYVFTETDSPEMFSKKKLYKYWNEIVKMIDFDISGRNLSYYSFRHYGITERLSAQNTTIWDIAKMAGTSAVYIESHYGHGSLEAMSRTASARNDLDGMPDFGAPKRKG